MRGIILLWLGILAIPSFSQKPKNPELLNSLKAAYKNEKVKVASPKSNTTITYQVQGSNLIITNEDVVELISLEGNINYAKHTFYNDHIKVESTDIRVTSGKSMKKETTCGNYEVDGIFYSDAKVCTSKINFLYEGTEVSFKSKTKYDDARYLTRVFFHDDEPTISRTITFTIPEQVDVEFIENNFDGFNIKKTVDTNAGNKIYTYTAQNLNELKSEPNSLGALYYYPHILVITKKYHHSNGETTVLGSVNDLYKWYSLLTSQVKNDPSSFKEEVQRITASAKTSEEKIRAIYYWVQDNIKYIAFEDGIAGFKPEAAQNVYNNRYGDCKGMANLTKEMLRAAGFDARLTWIGTNRIPYTYDVPSLAVDNHMICTVNSDGKEYILDSTEKFIAIGKNAERIQGKEMLIENGDQFIRKKVPVSDHNANLITRTETISIDGESLAGQGELTLNGETKKTVLYYSTNIKQEDQKKILHSLAVSDYSNKDQVEVSNTPPADREKPLDIKYTYKLSNKVTRFDKDIYVEFDWNKTYSNMDIESTRLSDYYLGKKVKYKTVKKIKIPAGYKVTHQPSNLNKKTSEFVFDVSFKLVGNELVYTNEISVPKGIIKKNDFEEWNATIKQLKEIYNDQIVLTKIK